MWRSGLVLLFVFAGALFLNRGRIVALGLPAPWVLAALLALLATLCVGSVLGLWQALTRPSGSSGSPAEWRDGDTLRLEGTLRVEGEPVLAVFSRRPAAFFSYEGQAPARINATAMIGRPTWRGEAAARASLDFRGLRVALDGMPSLRHLPAEQAAGPEVLARAAQHLASTRWEVTRGPLQVDTELLGQLLAGAMPGSRRRDLINMEALDRLAFEPGRTRPDALLAALQTQGNWNLSERLLAAGDRVTVEGTWRAQPPRLDIGLSLAGAGHRVQPGTAAAMSRGEVWTAVAFVLVFGALTAGAHLLVHARGGTWLRGLIEFFRTAG